MHNAAAGKDTVKHADMQQIEGFDTLHNVTGTGDNKELHTSAKVELVVQADRLDAAIDIGSDVPGVRQTSNDQGKAKDQQTDRDAAEVVKPTVAHADLIENASSPIADLQILDQSKIIDWAVVNPTQSSPSKNNVSVHKTQSTTAKNVTVSNSYEALMTKQVLEDVWKDGQQDIRNWIRNIDQHASDNVNKILVGNKANMDESKRTVPTPKGQALVDEYEIKFFETSAKTNLNVEQVFFSIARDIKERLENTDIQG
ncbi:ras-related protein rabe1c [Nicotiana attenuata]|uniref:Ras-related protein rabe1c n=1 Tax=Nicotiana attenuata TaxID=49451 RepID=A0A1J6KP39_NICAT|nr:ras-related protein rabe1c [Nicotiana attenuata]